MKKPLRDSKGRFKRKPGSQPPKKPKPRFRPFETDYLQGIRGDWKFEATLPINADKFQALIDKRVRPALKRGIQPGQKYYITVLILVEGVVYQVQFLPSDDEDDYDEDDLKSFQWFSTKATSNPDEVESRLVDLFSKIERTLEDRPGKMLRVGVTLYEKTNAKN